MMNFIEIAKKRCSVRSYSDKKVEKEKLDKILQAAHVAPTAANLQPVHLITVESKEGLEKISKGANIYNAPLAIIVCADHNKAWVRPFDKKQTGVKIIDKNKDRCEELSEMLPDATIICGDGTDRSLLLEEGLSTVESFVTLTNMDEENIFLSLSAKNLTQAKLIAKVNRLPYKDVIDDLDIGSVIYPKYITSDSILRYVRAMQNTIGSNVETLYHVLDNQAEALEFIIRDESPVVGIPLADLNLKPNLLVCCLTREGTVRIPRGQDSIQIGDNVIIVTTHKGLRDIRDILA